MRDCGRFLSKGRTARRGSRRAAILRLQFLPLIGGKHGTKSPEHARVGLFEFDPRFGHAVELSENARLLRVIGGKQGVENGLFSIERSGEIDQFEPVLLKDFFDPALLIFRQAESLDHGGIEPPLAFGAIGTGGSAPPAAKISPRLAGRRRRRLLGMKSAARQTTEQKKGEKPPHTHCCFVSVAAVNPKSVSIPGGTDRETSAFT